MKVLRWLNPWIHRLPARVRLVDRRGERLGHLDIGRLGERLVSIWLRREGCRILMRNYRAPRGGEIDLVVRDGAVLVFVEVKTRTGRRFGRPLEAVDAAKRRLIERGARAWLRQLPFDLAVPVRFDVLEVMLTDGAPPEINRVSNAFQTEDGLAWARRGRRFDPKAVRRRRGTAEAGDKDAWTPL